MKITETKEQVIKVQFKDLPPGSCFQFTSWGDTCLYIKSRNRLHNGGYNSFNLTKDLIEEIPHREFVYLVDNVEIIIDRVKVVPK